MWVPGDPSLERSAVQCGEHRLGIRRRWCQSHLPAVCCVYSSYRCFAAAAIQSVSCVQLFVTPRTVTRQASLCMGFPRQEYLSGLPFPSPGHLPNAGIELTSTALQADCLPLSLPGKPLLSLQKLRKHSILSSVPVLKQYRWCALLFSYLHC